jgi:hypothetical protein
MNRLYTEMICALGGIKFTFIGGFALITFFICDKKMFKSLFVQKLEEGVDVKYCNSRRDNNVGDERNDNDVDERNDRKKLLDTGFKFVEKVKIINNSDDLNKFTYNQPTAMSYRDSS